MARLSDKRRFAILAPPEWYADWEKPIKSLANFSSQISKLTSQNSDRTLVWRGVSDANLSLTSSLFRNLASEASDGTLVLPTEFQMQSAERKILDSAFGDWRMDKLDPHTIMAQLQHLGAPTRFIDITKNPFVALWFACANDWGDDKDGRILAFGIKNKAGQVAKAPESKNNDLSWSGSKSIDGWGKNSGVNIWFPPLGTHLRVFAQNAGFIYGGLPITHPGSNTSYLKKIDPESSRRTYWSKEDVQQATTLHFNPTSMDRKSRADSEKTPCWTFRIPARSKESIRKSLESDLGLTRSMLFPGMEGFADALSSFQGPLIDFDT